MQRGEALGLDSRAISACEERFSALQHDGEWEQLFNDRAAERSDTTPVAWLEFALDYWTQDDLQCVRTAESASAEIRNPQDRKAPKKRICYLEKGIGEMHTLMREAGLTKYGDKFSVGLTRLREMRPFYVKVAHRWVPSLSRVSRSGLKRLPAGAAFGLGWRCVWIHSARSRMTSASDGPVISIFSAFHVPTFAFPVPCDSTNA